MLLILKLNVAISLRQTLNFVAAYTSYVYTSLTVSLIHILCIRRYYLLECLLARTTSQSHMSNHAHARVIYSRLLATARVIEVAITLLRSSCIFTTIY